MSLEPCVLTRMMMKSSSPYRFTALTLVLSFVLGTALTGACYGSDGEAVADDHSHSQGFCAAPCHVAKAPAEATPALLLEAGRLPAGEELRALPVLLSPSRRAASSPGGIRLVWLPVRLHVFHAIFLN